MSAGGGKAARRSRPWGGIEGGRDWIQGRWERIRRELGSVGEIRAELGAWRTALIASAAAAIVAFIPRVMTAGQPHIPDELLWMTRSADFSDAVFGLNFADASATTGRTASMPGVTTMWLGTIARGVLELGRALGFFGGSGFVSAVGLDLAQLAVAAATSILIGLLVLLAWRWAGAIAAIAAGALLATEPYIVSQGAVLHTDELEGLFGATGALALLIALGVPDGGTKRPRAMAALAGVLLAGAFLSKLTALLLAPGLAVIVGWALVQAVRRPDPGAEPPAEASLGAMTRDQLRELATRRGVSPSGGKAEIASRLEAAGVEVGDEGREKALPQDSLAAMRPVARLVGIVLAAGIATTLLAWPAIWADPLDQLSFLRRSGELGREGHLQFFLGEVTVKPGPLYYLVTIPFKVTPWFLLGMLATIAAAIDRSTRPRLAALAVVALPALIGLSLASKQIGRYAVGVLPLFALMVGLGLDALWTLLRRERFLRQRDRSVRRIAPLAAASLIALMLAHSMWVAPWGDAYYNPALGGGRVAERTILIAGTYGHDRAGELISEREAPECDVTIAVLSVWAPQSMYPCGSVERIRRASELGDRDYVVVVADYAQRFPNDAEALRASGPTVAVATFQGATHAEIIKVDAAQASRPQSTGSDSGASTPGAGAPSAGRGEAQGPGPAPTGYQR